MQSAVLILPARILEASSHCSQSAGVNKTIYSRQNECVRLTMIALRKKAGMTQRQLAAKLERERSLVGRVELGERRVDIVEFFWFCRACGADPVKESVKLVRQFEALPC
jgi:DNA-binding XRE family transcriptional regulator